MDLAFGIANNIATRLKAQMLLFVEYKNLIMTSKTFQKISYLYKIVLSSKQF